MTLHTKRNPRTRPGHLWLMSATCLVFVLGVLSGCDDESVRSYQAPKGPAYVPPAPIGPAVGQATTEQPITWNLPDDWRPMPGGSGMALASFTAPGEAGPAKVTVTVLSGQAGGILANINRWRGQVGLGPVHAIEEQPMTGVRVDQSPAGLIDLTSTQGTTAGVERMLVVLVPRQQDNRTWFFKMTGPNDTVARHKQAFIGFVQSVSFPETPDE